VSGYTLTEAAFILAELNYGFIKLYNDKVSASCTCNPSKDDRSFIVKVTGKFPGYWCHRCKMKGTLADLVGQSWARGYNPTQAMTVVCAHEQARLLDEDYSPATKKATVYDPAPYSPKILPGDNEPMKHLHSVQLNLSGRVSQVAAAKPLTERDYNRFRGGPSKLLLQRGISRYTQARYGIRLNMWSRRIVMPIRDWEGKLQGWSQRRTHEGPDCFKCEASILNKRGDDLVHKCPACGMFYPKYMHSKGFKRNQNLYGEWLYEPGCVPVMVEGMTDAHNLFEKNLRPPFALPLGVMGGSAADTQVERLLLQFPDGPIFTIRDHDDPEEYPDLHSIAPGKAPGDLMVEGLEAHVFMLDPSRPVFHIIPPMKCDPGTLDFDQVDVVRAFMESAIADPENTPRILTL